MEIETEELRFPLSTSEYLRLRVIPIEIARQFKAMASRGRHIQRVPPGSAQAILRYGRSSERGPKVLRRLSLVKAESAEAGVEILEEADRRAQYGDFVFLVGDREMLGFHEAAPGETLRPAGEPISIPPAELADLMARAKKTAVGDDEEFGEEALAEALSERYFRPRETWRLFEVAVALRLARAFASRSPRRRTARLLVGNGRMAYAHYCFPGGTEVALLYQAWPEGVGKSLLHDVRDRHRLRERLPAGWLVAPRSGAFEDCAADPGGSCGWSAPSGSPRRRSSACSPGRGTPPR